MRVLITQHELVKFAGSEIATLELVEYFSGIGCEVTVLTDIFDNPLKKYFSRLNSVKVVINDDSIHLDYTQYDVIWIHHQLIPHGLIVARIEGRCTAKIIFYHMSSYHPLESPWSGRIESYLADLIVYNSEETRQAIRQKGLAGKKRLDHIMYNAAPDIFLRERAKVASSPKIILAVSNHPPEELKEAYSLLRLQGHKIVLFGAIEGGTFKRITPKDIQRADVVVSIGKTVQYALLGSTPVFCYDHFGGPGYIRRSNVDLAKKLNFSGRGFGRMTAKQIAQSLINGYHDAQKEVVAIKHKNVHLFTLSSQIETILKKASENYNARHKRSPTQLEVEAFNAIRDQVTKLHVALHRSSQDFTHILESHKLLEERLEGANRRIKELERQLQGIDQSASWRLTKGLRVANSVIHKGEGVRIIPEYPAGD